MSPAKDVPVNVRLTHDQLAAAGEGANTLTRRPEVAVEPGERALPRVQTMLALPEAVAFARVGRDLGDDALLAQAGVEFLCLAERRAAIFGAVDYQCRRCRFVQSEERRAVEGYLAETLLAERAAAMNSENRGCKNSGSSTDWRCR